MSDDVHWVRSSVLRYVRLFARRSETTAIEPERGLQHVRKHVDMEEPVAVAQARKLLRHRQLADAWQTVYEV